MKTTGSRFSQSYIIHYSHYSKIEIFYVIITQFIKLLSEMSRSTTAEAKI